MANHFLFLLVGYIATVAIELPILWFGLPKSHTASEKLFAGFWLTACTYPIVVLVFPQLIPIDQHRWLFLVVAESFALLVECALLVAFVSRTHGENLRACTAIAAANLLSASVAESIYWIAAP